MMKILIKKDEQNDKNEKILEQNSSELVSKKKKKSKIDPVIGRDKELEKSD